MPFTTPKGYPFPTSDQTPDVPRDITLLAEAINDSNAATDVTVADLAQRVADLESGKSAVGWVPIVNEFTSGNTFTVDLTAAGKFPVGEFAMLRLSMRFDMDTAEDVLMRINADDSAVYTSGIYNTDVDTAADVNDRHPYVLHQPNATGWWIGRAATVSTNSLVCEILHTSGIQLHTFQSRSARQSTTASAHSLSQAFGSLESTLSAAPSSLVVIASGAAAFTNVWYWAEGFRTG